MNQIKTTNENISKLEVQWFIWAVVIIPSEWPCKVCGDFVAIHCRWHQDHLGALLGGSTTGSLNQPQGAAENNFPWPIESTFLHLSQTNMCMQHHATRMPPKSSQNPAFTSWLFINTRVTTKLKRKSMCWSPSVVVGLGDQAIKKLQEANGETVLGNRQLVAVDNIFWS